MSRSRKSEKKILIILGSGLDSMLERISEPLSVKTSFGIVSLNRLNDFGDSTYVMVRHGREHSIPPHLINYRANIVAAKQLGVSYIIATASVGSLKYSIPVGAFVVLDQFIDFTKGRPSSVYYDSPNDFAHTDMTNPYSLVVRDSLVSSLKKSKIRKFRTSGTYVCTEGPRFETPAEIRMFQRLGGDVVGMTGVPEVVIANELGIEYGCLSLVSNMAAGLQRGKIAPEKVLEEMEMHQGETKKVLETAVKELLKRKP